jgi:gliding motility-associated-like protein
MKNFLLSLLLFLPIAIFGQCAGIQSATFSPQPINGTYPPNTVVDVCYTMDGWNTSLGSNWVEGFEITLGPGWTSCVPTSGPPSNCSNNGTWIWMNSVTSSQTGQTAGPGYFYEGPQGPVDGNPGNDWGDFGTTCQWNFCFQVTSSSLCDPLSLSIEVTPYGDGTMGSWTNQSCNDPAYMVFNGTISGGTVNTSPISIPSDSLCNLLPSTFSVVNTPGSTYQWSYPNATFIGNGTSQITIPDWNGLVGLQTIAVQEITASGCVGDVIDTNIVLVEPYSFAGVDVNVCPNDTYSLVGIPSNGFWSGTNVQNSQFSSPTPGDYWCTYQTNTFGCIAVDSMQVTVNQPPITNYILGPTEIDFCNDSYSGYFLTNEIEFASYVWHIDNQLILEDDSQLFTYFEDTTNTYEISVFAIDTIGCYGEPYAITVETNECNRLYVPNSFTPNGDGFNDTFMISGLGLYEPELNIYDRWGGLIVGINNQNLSWNGNDGNGYFVQDGVYNWTLYYRDGNGFRHFERGHVVLIR